MSSRPSARCRPIRRGRRCEPPPPGIWPKLAWWSPMRASSATMAKSQACISSKPPASAWPSTTATTTAGKVAIAARASPNASKRRSSPPGGPARSSATSPRSPPAEKLPPAPRMMIAVASCPSSSSPAGQGAGQLDRHRVHLLGPVEGDEADAIDPLDDQGGWVAVSELTWPILSPAEHAHAPASRSLSDAALLQSVWTDCTRRTGSPPSCPTPSSPTAPTFPSTGCSARPLGDAFGESAGKGARVVASFDEDSTTLGVEAARRALRAASGATPRVDPAGNVVARLPRQDQRHRDPRGAGPRPRRASPPTSPARPARPWPRCARPRATAAWPCSPTSALAGPGRPTSARAATQPRRSSSARRPMPWWSSSARPRPLPSSSIDGGRPATLPARSGRSASGRRCTCR